MIPMSKPESPHKPSMGIGITSLLLNILVFPGIGSMVGGKVQTGIIQMVLMILAIVLDFTLIGLLLGIPLGISVWIWSLITSIKIIQESQK